MNTDLIIVGGGAAGLMAACRASDERIKAVVIERKHRPGRKLLLCGNNRCNLTSNLAPDEMLAGYGPPVAAFLRQAIQALPPRKLISWFNKHGLRTVVKPDKRVYPRTEKADDVLHFFTDTLRNNSVPLLLNSPVQAVKQIKHGFVVTCDRVELSCRSLLIATGGVTYPKTGSVGDGQKWARALGHKVTPYRPGLAGVTVTESWLCTRDDDTFPDARVAIMVRDRSLGTTRGVIVCERWGLSGKAVIDATRIASRMNLKNYRLMADLCPELDEEALARELIQRSQRGRRNLDQVLGDWLVPQAVVERFVSVALECGTKRTLPPGDQGFSRRVAAKLKHWELPVGKTRPLKESMVTVGGVDLGGIDNRTMQSRKHRGLYFAGEVMDVDGPTGGYNLQAAFSTAQLAIRHIASRGRR